MDCRSESYRTFRGVTICFVIAYQSMPVLWFLLLFRRRKRLNPPVGQQPVSSALLIRKRDPSVRHLQFLFSEYKPAYWYYEVVYMYKRLFLVGVLPLLGEGTARASIGCFAAIVLAVAARENAPFVRAHTNTLLVCSWWQILSVFYAAFVILSGNMKDFGLSDFALGLVLVLMNMVRSKKKSTPKNNNNNKSSFLCD